MACNKREETGRCPHYQCPFSEMTKHGYECVDVFTSEVNGAPVSFCEIGEGCLTECPLSWKKGDNSAQEKAAEKWLKDIESEFNY